MKRRGFLGLLGMAPTAPLIARDLVKAGPAPEPIKQPEQTVSYAPGSEDWHMCTMSAYGNLTLSWTVNSPISVKRR